MLTFHANRTPPFSNLHPENLDNLDEIRISKIPFLFTGIPWDLIDEKIADATLAEMRVIVAIGRRINLKDKHRLGDFVLLTGWTIPISQQAIAQYTNLRRETVNRVIKQLLKDRIIQRKPASYGRYQYRFREYDVTLEDLPNGGHVESQSDIANYANPSAPSPQQLHEYEGVTRESHAPVTDESHIIKDIIKEIHTLSFDRKEKNSLSIGQLKRLHPDWEEYRKYAEAFYGEIHSEKLLINASVYFKEQAQKIGFAPDGADRTMEMIRKVKAQGAYHHTAFDEQFGVEAFARVKEEESERLKRQEEEQLMKARREAHAQKDHVHPDGHQSTDSSQDQDANLGDVEDAESDIHQNVPPSRPESAKETVAIRVHARHSLASVGVGQPYTDADIETLFREAYERHGPPKNPEEWLGDRIHLRDRLVGNGIKAPHTEAEVEELRQKARQWYGAADAETD